MSSPARYGRALAVKTVVVVVVVVLGGVAMLGAGRANAVQASRFLGAQGVGAGLVALLAAVLALLAPPGMAAPPTLAGVALGDVVRLDLDAFDAESGVISLMTQPAAPGAQTVVVRLTNADGASLTSDEAPAVEVVWTPLGGSAQPAEPAASVVLQADASGTVSTGSAMLAAGWQQADVTITPPGGIASRAQFWLVVPDPNVAGAGPNAASNPEAKALYERGLASLTALQSVRYSQRSGDGSGTIVRTEVSVRAAEGERPAAFAETVVGADGEAMARQTIVGDRRWVLEDGAWIAAEPIPFLIPAAWGETYAGADAFQLGPARSGRRRAFPGRHLSHAAGRRPGPRARLVRLVGGIGQRPGAAGSDGLDAPVRRFRVPGFQRPARHRSAGCGADVNSTPNRSRHAGCDQHARSSARRYVGVYSYDSYSGCAHRYGNLPGGFMASTTVRIRPHTYRVLAGDGQGAR